MCFRAKNSKKASGLRLAIIPLGASPRREKRARELQRLIDEGRDPRDLKRDRQAVAAEKKAPTVAQLEADKVQALTVSEVWAAYIKERKPNWGALHYRDHIDKAKAGGLASGRRGGSKQLTKPGPLAGVDPFPRTV